MLAEIEGKLDKWQEPPPVKSIKALPAPIDPGRKKRGGRRYRKMKERLGLTEMRKQANRMNFGEVRGRVIHLRIQKRRSVQCHREHCKRNWNFDLETNIKRKEMEETCRCAATRSPAEILVHTCADRGRRVSGRPWLQLGKLEEGCIWSCPWATGRLENEGQNLENPSGMVLCRPTNVLLKARFLKDREVFRTTSPTQTRTFCTSCACSKSCRSSKSGAAARRSKSRCLEQRPVWHLHHCKGWRS